ncbi:MAG TPA: CYTH domain-containing protein [Bacteroidales bacterium]|nr:CYTH domain-containing protein [Bacteroidales bacterium]NMD04131.1 CYTH domain-containing protein [Bacteroidales bacterium]HOU03232.1 CYTH domain-containing protein [Bacteroidales bacterium]HQG63832.1 CYTH domain-containing protein [Bacteroidales bacterium]HQK66860.1 CYTH domain-containing protein [Bacteroidales bacterium]
MKREIERKFIVTGEFRKDVLNSTRIIQGYLSSVPGRTVRIRIRQDKAFITIKGPGDPSGISRYEWEKEISVPDAEDLLNLCEPGIIEKVRHEVKIGKHVYEVDEFLGENSGLIIAELELSDENESYEKPVWLGKEVTGDIRFYSSFLSAHPYSKW